MIENNEPLPERVIGLDADDVLLDTVPYWVADMNVKYNRDNRFTQIRAWDMKPYLGLTHEQIFACYTPELYERIRPMMGAQNGVTLLSQMFTIDVVTSSTPETQAAKDARIRALFPEVRNIIHTSNKFYLDHIEMLYDDGVHNFAGAKYAARVFNRPWNMQNNTYSRVLNWNDITGRYRYPVFSTVDLEREYKTRVEQTTKRFHAWLQGPTPPQSAEIAYARELSLWDDWKQYEERYVAETTRMVFRGW